MNAEQEIRAKLGDFAADQDLMRDVYMTDSQRAAYQRILSRALEQREGFVMVPVEPTPEMVNAACAIKLRRLTEFASGKDGSGIEAGIREDYAAMLAAAQSSDNKEADRG